jgi:hypothetical protein
MWSRPENQATDGWISRGEGQDELRNMFYYSALLIKPYLPADLFAIKGNKSARIF